jgi:hypothetical protein
MSSREENCARAGYNVVQQGRSQRFRADLAPRPDEVRGPRRGRIVRYYQRVGSIGIERIEVEIRFDDRSSDIQQGSYGRTFVLSHTPEELAMLYGDPDSIIGKIVEVKSAGLREDQGFATIVGNSGKGNLEKANTLKPFGTLLAPAGGTMI